MKKPDDNRNLMRYSGLAMQWLVMLGVAVWGGMKLDGIIGWKFPLLTVLLPLAAICISLWQLIRSLNKP